MTNDIVPGIGFVAELENADDLFARLRREIRCETEFVDFGARPVAMPRTPSWQLRRGSSGERIAIPLAHRSVLLVTVQSQLIWQHSVPIEPPRALA